MNTYLTKDLDDNNLTYIKSLLDQISNKTTYDKYFETCLYETFKYLNQIPG